MTPTSKIGVCFAVCTTIDTVGIVGPMGPMDLSKWAFLEARKIASNSYVSQGSHCCFSSESRVEQLDGSGNQDLQGKHKRCDMWRAIGLDILIYFDRTMTMRVKLALLKPVNCESRSGSTGSTGLGSLLRFSCLVILVAGEANALAHHAHGKDRAGADMPQALEVPDSTANAVIYPIIQHHMMFDLVMGESRTAHQLPGAL